MNCSLRLLCTILFVALLVQKSSAQFQYISPLPGSKMHHVETNIILRNGNLIDEASLKNQNLFTVTGSSSGRHYLTVVLSDDHKTILLYPNIKFNEGEDVSVTIADGIKTTSGKTINGTAFNFFTISPRTPEIQQRLDDAYRHVYEQEFGPLKENEDNTTRDLSDWQHGIPPFTMWTNTNPTPGDIFFANVSFVNNQTANYCIINNDGDSIYGKHNAARGINFYLNHNGLLTVYNSQKMRFEVLDSNYSNLTNLSCGNGYSADVHECQYFPDKHCYLIAYDPEPFDMTIYNSSYNPNATVIGCIVQELDANKNVVFQWRSWDYFEVTDAQHVLFTTDEIDYVHGNSIEVDNDGNLLLSCRHLEEVTKINHTTGDIVWRWGGIHNDFTFINDPQHFSYQHDVRRIPNGHITMFDNGNYHIPQHTFVKEYALDEVAMTATLVWKYDRDSTNTLGHSVALGSVQRLSNGNTFISWGLTYSANFPSLSEVDTYGNILWEMRLGYEFNDGIYRAHRFTWTPCARPSSGSLTSSLITQTSAKLKWKAATNALGYEVRYKKQGTAWTSVQVTTPGLTITGLSPNTKYNWKVRSLCNPPNPLTSVFTDQQSFKTLPAKLSGDAELLSFEVYPNPAHNVLNLELNDMTEGTITVRMTNLVGQQVYEKKDAVYDGENIISIPVIDMNAGIYVVEIFAGDQRYVQKVMVQ